MRGGGGKGGDAVSVDTVTEERSELRLELPLPALALRPNGRPAHWTVKNRAVRNARNTARLVVLTKPVRERSRAWTCYRLEIYTRAREWDDDNVVGAAKAYLDGIADQLGLNDRDLRLAGDPAVTRRRDGKNPRLVVVLSTERGAA